MFLRLTGAAVRAMLVAILVVLPAFILPNVSQFALELTRIFATIAIVFVIYEYGFKSPSLIEFRFSAPYNRIRYVLIAALILYPTYFIGKTALFDHDAGMVMTIAQQSNALFSFKYSPVSIVAQTLSGTDFALATKIEYAISFNILIAFACVVAFSIAIFSRLWQFGGSNFNVWLNMPTYNASDVKQLNRKLINSAYGSFLLACLTPLFGPTMADVLMVTFATDGMLPQLGIVWMVAIWVYVPAAFLMRSAALLQLSVNVYPEQELVAA